MTKSHSDYLSQLNHPSFRESTDPRDLSEKQINGIEKTLERVHQLRRFEIENYWKRSTYFWAFQITSFTLLGFVINGVARSSLNTLYLLIPCGLGCLTALAGYMTARGSKFWQQNWEAHVDALEGYVDGNLTKVLLYKNELQFSVSRVNQRLLLIISLSWLLAFLMISILGPLYQGSCICHGAIALLSLIIVLAFQYFGMKTKSQHKEFLIENRSTNLNRF